MCGVIALVMKERAIKLLLPSTLTCGLTITISYESDNWSLEVFLNGARAEFPLERHLLSAGACRSCLTTVTDLGNTFQQQD